MTSIADIRRVLAGHKPCLSSRDGTRAAVAMVLHQQEEAVQLLFIERSQRDDDPWSGHVAFPGGRVDRLDGSPRLAAERETREEVGLDLGPAEYLGRLDDVTGATLPVLVSGFVYNVRSAGRLHPNDEVKQAFWVRLSELVVARRHHRRSFRIDDAERRFSTVDLPGPGRRVLWGITYRLVAQLFVLAGIPFPATPTAPDLRCRESGAAG